MSTFLAMKSKLDVGYRGSAHGQQLCSTASGYFGSWVLSAITDLSF